MLGNQKNIAKFMLGFSINKELIDFEDKKEMSGKLFKVLVIILIVLSISSWLFYYNQGLTLAYNDARSRLNISRRMVDSLQPGLAQVGSVWLPLFHILELPLVWNYQMWQSGFAGSLISMISYVLGGVFLIKLLQKMEFKRIPIIIAFIVYAINPNILFMQTLAMTESLLIFLSIASCYYLYLWSKDFKLLNIIYASFFILLSSLTRYDGWFLLLFSALFVGYISYKKRKLNYSIGNIILFLSLASLGVVLWFLWNKLIFGNFFYFAFGPYSAKAQQDVLLSEGRLLSKGSLIYSTFLYLLTVLYNSGIWIGILAIIGGLIYFLKKDNKMTGKLILFLLSIPFVFNIVSLYTGNSVIHLPNVEPYAWFNDRYGLMMLPVIAVFFAYLVSKSKLSIYFSIFIIIFQIFYMYFGNNIITIEDGIRGSSGNFLNDAGSWIKNNAKDGLILVAASSNDALIFTSGLPLNRFIVEGTRRYWDDSMVDPTRYAKWIIMKKGDLVESKLHENPIFLNNYILVYKDSFAYIYVLNKDGQYTLKSNDLP